MAFFTLFFSTTEEGCLPGDLDRGVVLLLLLSTFEFETDLFIGVGERGVLERGSGVRARELELAPALALSFMSASTSFFTDSALRKVSS